MKKHKFFQKLLIVTCLLANFGASSGDFTPFYKQVDSITNEVLRVHFIGRGRCPTIRQCQLDGYIKFSSKNIYVYGVVDVDSAIAIVNSMLQQQKINKLPELSITIYRESNQDANRKKIGDLSVLVKVESFVKN